MHCEKWIVKCLCESLFQPGALDTFTLEHGSIVRNRFGISVCCNINSSLNMNVRYQQSNKTVTCTVKHGLLYV